MGSAASAIFYAVFVWWFSTGLVFWLVLRRRATFWSMVGASLLFPVSLYLLAKSSVDRSVLGTYVAFTAAILLWGTQEIAFLTGFLTGPRPLPCPPKARGLRRAYYAICAILYHELALLVTGLAAAAVTWGHANQVGAATFLILWTMRLSAKLNLFLGVPVLNDDLMPEHLFFLRSYFVRGPVNGLLPMTMIVSSLATAVLLESVFAIDASATTQSGCMLLAALLALAITEHGFMLVRLPVDALWRWSTEGGPPSRSPALDPLDDVGR